MLQELCGDIQRAIKRKAWRKDISYEKAVVELLQDAEIERMIQHDVALMERWRHEDDEPF